MVAPTTKIAREYNSHRAESEAGTFVSQGIKRLPTEILTTGEQPLYETRPLLWPLLVGPALFCIVGIVIFVIAQQIQLEFIRTITGQVPLEFIRMIIRWIGIGILLAGLLGVLSRWLRWSYTVYAVTNRRILRQTGIIGKSYVDCSLSRVQTLYLQIPILGRIFGFGSIRVATAGGAGIEIQWEGVKQPRNAHRTLNEVIEQHRREAASSTNEN